jgi:hypothetical protein
VKGEGQETKEGSALNRFAIWIFLDTFTMDFQDVRSEDELRARLERQGLPKYLVESVFSESNDEFAFAIHRSLQDAMSCFHGIANIDFEPAHGPMAVYASAQVSPESRFQSTNSAGVGETGPFGTPPEFPKLRMSE